MIWELFLGMFLVIGFATLFVYSVEIYEWFCTIMASISVNLNLTLTSHIFIPDVWKEN